MALTIRDKQVQEQEQFNKIRNTKYNRIYKFIGKMGLPGYLEDKEGGESQKLIARARCDNLEERNKYWMSEDEKLYELCLPEEGAIKCKIKEYQKLERIELSIENIMKDQSNQEVEKWLMKVKNEEKVQKRKKGNTNTK